MGPTEESRSGDGYAIRDGGCSECGSARLRRMLENGSGSSHMKKRRNRVAPLSGAILVAATLLVVCGLSAARAGRHLSWSAKIPAGETTITTNLLWSGPARKRDRKYVIKRYSIHSSAAVALMFIVTRLDGSSESFTASGDRNDSFNHVFVGGILDLRITRLSSDTDQAIFVRGTLSTCVEGESDCP